MSPKFSGPNICPFQPTFCGTMVPQATSARKPYGRKVPEQYTPTNT